MIVQAARFRIYKVPLVDPERAIDDPALAALHAAGWTVAASFMAAEGDGKFLVFVLAPPVVQPDVVAAVRALDERQRWVIGWQAVLAVTMWALLGVSIAASLR